MMQLDTWHGVKDGDDRARALMRRHYSWYEYRDGRPHLLFVGPGEKTVLLTADCRAVFVWRKFIDKSGQQGVNCAAFRNEGERLSSDLIREADDSLAALASRTALHLRQPSRGPVAQSRLLLSHGRVAALRLHEGRTAHLRGAAMIIVTVELKSANGAHRDKQLYKMVITNDGSGDERVGNYDVYLGRRRDTDPIHIMHNALREGRVEGHRRKSTHVGSLIRRASEAVGL